MGTIALLLIAPLLAHVYLVVYDDNPARGHAACVAMLAHEQPGTSCIVVPRHTPVTTQEYGQDYVEYNNDTLRGQQECTNDLTIDTNPRSTCRVAPMSEYPGNQ